MAFLSLVSVRGCGDNDARRGELRNQSNTNKGKNMAKTETVNDVTVDAPGTEVAGIDEETSQVRGAVDVAEILESMNDPKRVVTTISGDDFNARLTLASALTSSEPLDGVLGETIQLADYVITEASFVDARTSEVVTAPRCVLLDADGKGYHATSVGILTSLRNLKLAIGDKWGEQPVPVKVVRQKGNNGFYYFTINIVR